MRNKQTQGICLGLGGRRSLKRFVVQGPYDKPESLMFVSIRRGLNREKATTIPLLQRPPDH